MNYYSGQQQSNILCSRLIWFIQYNYNIWVLSGYQTIPMQYLIENTVRQNNLCYAAVLKKVNGLTEQRSISCSRKLALAAGNCPTHDNMKSRLSQTCGATILTWVFFPNCHNRGISYQLFMASSWKWHLYISQYFIDQTEPHGPIQLQNH